VDWLYSERVGRPGANQLRAAGGPHFKVGGATASTEMLAAARHTGVHTPVTVAKTILANQNLAYAA